MPLADILFVCAPHYNFCYPPAGIGYLCEAVKSKGFTPEFFDFNIALVTKYGNNGIEPFWDGGTDGKAMRYWWVDQGFEEIVTFFEQDLKDAVEHISRHPAPLIGFTVNDYNLRCSDFIARRVKAAAPDKTVVYGGWACYHPALCRNLSPVPDYIFVGESEDSLPGFMSARNEGEDLTDIAGVWANRDDIGFRLNPPVKHIDEIPWPRWSEFNLQNYVNVDPFRILSVAGSRGCRWQRCHFCSDIAVCPGFRSRSAQSIFEEIKWNHRNNQVRDFHFSDQALNGDPQLLEDFCDLVIASDLDIAFTGQFHFEKHLTGDLFRKLKRAGLPVINFGLESGSEKVLKLMRKGFTIPLAERCLKDAKAADIVTSVNLMVGYPGETWDDLHETADFIERNQAYIDMVEVINMCGIQYGSDLWQFPEKFQISFNASSYGWEDREWVSLDEANTIDERRKRLCYLSAIVDKLGIERGFVSRSIKFFSREPRYFNPALYRFRISQTLSQCPYLDSPKTILVLRSCGLDQFDLFLDGLMSQYPFHDIDLLLQAEVEPSLQETRLKPSIKNIFTYPGGPIAQTVVPNQTIQDLKKHNYDLIIIPLGLMPVTTYVHVVEFAKTLGAENVMCAQLSGELDFQV